MNFSIGRIASKVKNAIGAIISSNLPVVDVYQREYSSPYSMNIVIPITSNTNKSYQIPDLDFFRDKLILGISTRKQNAADSKYSKNGKLLINDAALTACFLRLSQNNLQVHESIPLENLVHDSSGGRANTYYQLLIEGGFTPQSSTVEFAIAPGATNNGRDVELLIHYVPLSATCYQ